MSTSPPPSRIPLRSFLQGQRGVILLGILLLAIGVRWAFAFEARHHCSDLWRHLVLLKNVGQGRGFVLFGDQPYIWYSPVWYYLAGTLTTPENGVFIAAGCSGLATLFFVFYLYRLTEDHWPSAAAAGVLFALFGPLLAHASGYGGEALGLLLLMLALWIFHEWPNRSGALAAGIVFGLAILCRTQFLLAGPLFLRSRLHISSLVLIGLGSLMPLAWEYHRRQAVLGIFEYVFAWDGLACRADEFTPLSTLVMQLHPDIRQALQELHRQIVPRPEWLYGYTFVRFDLLAFYFLGLTCVLRKPRLGYWIAGVGGFVYFALFDATQSANVNRIWLGWYPIPLAALAEIIGPWLVSRRLDLKVLAVVTLLLTLLLGVGDLWLRPIDHPRIPKQSLTESHYLVNSGHWHPEILIHDHRDRHFLGLPLRPKEFPRFVEVYPEYRTILWHKGFSVQEPIREFLLQNGYRVVHTHQDKTIGYEVLQLP